MVDNKTRKLLLIVVPILCVILIALSVFVNSRWNQETRVDASTESEDVEDVEIIDPVGVPRIASLDPKSVIEGESFRYFLTIIDSDTPLSMIEVELLEAPSWMSFSNEGNYLYGTPTLGSSDTEKVTLLIDDGDNRIEHTFYILVLPKDE